MSTKNRLIQNFVSLVPDYTRSKCERYESGIQRCLQVICCMENLSVFDTSQLDIIEFFINLRELLRTCDNKSCLGWKAVELVKHLSSDSSIFQLLCELEFVPILSQYLHGQLEADKAVLLLSAIETLSEGIIVERTGYWLGNILKYLTNSILEKCDYTLPHLLAVLSNLCFENYVVITELQRENRSELLLQYLIQLQANNPLVQLHASQVVFSILATSSISEAMLANYLKTVVDVLPIGAKTHNTNLIQRCGSIFSWMSRDRLILEMMKTPHFQELLEDCLKDMVALLAFSKHTSTTNSILLFITKLLRTQLIPNKKFTEAYIPSLIPLFQNAALTENLLELLADLVKNSPSLHLMEDILEQLFSQVVNQLNNFKNPTCKTSCRILGHSLQILQKLYKVSPSNTRITSLLKPDSFVNIVSNFVILSEEVEEKKADSNLSLNSGIMAHYTSETRVIVVECLTLLAQIACRDADYLQKYSYMLGQPNVHQCLASAILQGDCHVKQDALALVGTLGFSSDSVMGLSHALDQLCTRRGSVTEDREQSINRAFLNWNLSPEQMKKIDNLTKQMLNQEKFWENMKKCEILELMELQLGRREREEHRLKLQLDSTQQDLNTLKINLLQIKAENERMMAMVLSKNELVESKEAENRGLTRRLEKMHETQRVNQSDWRKERERMQREKDKFELAQTEATNQIQAQLDSAMKQIRNLIQKNEDLDEELKKSQKTCEGLKLACEKKDKELEKQTQDLQEVKSCSDNLAKTLRKREKECEEKEREITSLSQAVKKSEILRQDLEARLIESEKSCQETKKKLNKLEKIQEFIYDLSSGKNKLFEDK
ncbi:LOW QUALITY PROTEIN: uncharacterized protein LOC130689033 [Daphnia carinata]|uniref:LOW QUALITY PROTEIN: uncharacterized protein LOC130689033 n=1 Tax=Daphnia carinata TaxID=120202 RepID=UPI00257DF165|nr:LOW QUALITY PROTEIN: uncharacterized protein LOC130689033 [Daphnia carinata]